jgi:hypothetical protein
MKTKKEYAVYGLKSHFVSAIESKKSDLTDILSDMQEEWPQDDFRIVVVTPAILKEFNDQIS